MRKLRAFVFCFGTVMVALLLVSFFFAVAEAAVVGDELPPILVEVFANSPDGGFSTGVITTSERFHWGVVIRPLTETVAGDPIRVGFSNGDPKWETWLADWVTGTWTVCPPGTLCEGDWSFTSTMPISGPNYLELGLYSPEPPPEGCEYHDVVVAHGGTSYSESVRVCGLPQEPEPEPPPEEDPFVFEAWANAADVVEKGDSITTTKQYHVGVVLYPQVSVTDAITITFWNTAPNWEQWESNGEGEWSQTNPGTWRWVGKFPEGEPNHVEIGLFSPTPLAFGECRIHDVYIKYALVKYHRQVEVCHPMRHAIFLPLLAAGE
ncbi:hypothetical protein OAL67_00190 [bacterium]|nr:hypothetical protein [bacterium]